MARSIHEEPGLVAFIDQVDRLPTLDRDDELDLARRYQAGDREAGDRLVTGHLRSVVKMAQKYRGYGIYLSDLVAEGSIGLLEAARRFEPDRGLRFLTYARYWIRAFMLSHILKHWSIVDLGTTALQSKLFFRLQAEHARLSVELGEGDASIDGRLADKFQTDAEVVRTSMQRLRRRDASMDAPVGVDGTTTLGDTMRDDEPDQEQVTAARELAAQVRQAVADIWPDLDKRERLILRQRLLPADEPETLAELGRRLGVTRERVRQVEHELKEKLKTAILDRSAPADDSSIYMSAA
ncbi:MAG TPA: sigma-70 family RNA polymerase sigma factor [Kofleriaceae bacterium]|jgi:RNA polymerase sigma-32 factor|nr:sigma-70 family RNA polymerase sigma factor [Kofleriaceae bacterium]